MHCVVIHTLADPVSLPCSLQRLMFCLPLHPSQITNHLLLGYISLSSVHSKSCLSCNLTNLTPSSMSISLFDWTPPQHLPSYLIGLADLFLAVFFSLNSLTLLCQSHLYLIPLTLTSWFFCPSQTNPTHLSLPCHPMKISLI